MEGAGEAAGAGWVTINATKVITKSQEINNNQQRHCSNNGQLPLGRVAVWAAPGRFCRWVQAGVCCARWARYASCRCQLPGRWESTTNHKAHLIWVHTCHRITGKAKANLGINWGRTTAWQLLLVKAGVTATGMGGGGCMLGCRLGHVGRHWGWAALGVGGQGWGSQSPQTTNQSTVQSNRQSTK